jgi:glycosyltransferase involved in cell wall biosynthesis
MNSVCVIFHRLGPYHWARLNAAGALFPTLGLEISAESTEYRWDKVSGQSTFHRVTLFPESDARIENPYELVDRVHKALDEHQPSAVAIPGWSDRGALAALAWCQKTGKPTIVMSESQASDGARGYTKEAIKRRLVGMCSSGLAGGAPHAAYLAKLGMRGDRIFTGYDVVDNDYFATRSDAARANAVELRARFALPERYFLASNRFIAKKNLRRLVEAFAAYQQLAGPEAWKLVILGDGPLKAQLLTQIKDLGLSAEVFLPGFKQYEELPAFYGLAGAFVHASTTEQWGLVVNEAMASGLPVLVSDRCGCASDLVVHGINGFTLNPLDVPALTESLLRMAGTDYDRAAMGRESRGIIAFWSPKKFAVKLQKATHAALENPVRKGSLLDRAVLQTLIRR